MLNPTIPKRYASETKSLKNKEMSELLKQYDPYYMYSDDYDYWEYQRAISKRIKELRECGLS